MAIRILGTRRQPSCRVAMDRDPPVSSRDGC
jgi:hypothetical protein